MCTCSYGCLTRDHIDSTTLGKVDLKRPFQAVSATDGPCNAPAPRCDALRRPAARPWTRDARSVQAKPVDVLRMATLGGAEALRRDKDLGCIAEGYRADLMTINLCSPSLVGAHASGNLVSALVMNAGRGDVKDVVVNGVFAKRDGKLTVDWPALAMRAEQSAANMVKLAAQVDWDKQWTDLAAGFQLPLA